MTADRYKVADEDVFEGRDRVIVDVAGREIAVFAVDGDYHAVLNYCVHQAGPLCEGALVRGQMRGADVAAGEDVAFWRYDSDQRSVKCPWHGWTFDVATGVNVKDDRYAVPTYDVDVEDGEVFVRL